MLPFRFELLGSGMLKFYLNHPFLLSLTLPGAEERAQKEAAKKEQELLRQKQKEQQELMEAQEKSCKENVEQIQKKMVQEREQLIREQNMMLEKQLQVGLLILLVVLVPQAVGESCQPGQGSNMIIIYIIAKESPLPGVIFHEVFEFFSLCRLWRHQVFCCSFGVLRLQWFGLQTWDI